nr:MULTISPECIES: hypothetical protein [unclassified Cryobacterium]
MARAECGLAGAVVFDEADDVQPGQERLDLAAVMEVHVCAAGPFIVGAEEFSGKPGAGRQRRADARPQVGEHRGVAEGQGKPRIDEVCGGQLGEVLEAGPVKDQAGLLCGAQARPDPDLGARVGVERVYGPAGGEQVPGLGARTAAQVDRSAGWGG